MTDIDAASATPDRSPSEAVLARSMVDTAADVRPIRVVIPTFRRNSLLAALLQEVDEHVDRLRTTPGAAPLVESTGIMVIDNDPESGARATVLKAHETARLPLEYLHERTPGIGAVRARALREVPGDALVVFIDDDELPGTEWILPLVRTWQATRAEVIVGRVLPRFLEQPSEWILAGEFFTRPEHPTGTVVPAGASSNMLVDAAALRQLGVSFDSSLGLHGGEDTLLTLQVKRAGGRTVWCRESAVHDLVPPSRAVPEWVLTRKFSHATTRVWIALKLAPGPSGRVKVRAAAVARGSALWGRAIIRLVIGTLAGSVRADAKGRRDAARAKGLIVGALGHRHVGYRR